MINQSYKNGSNNDHWETPDYIKEEIHRRFNYDLYFDPCPLKANFDGLLIPWDMKNFVNPPYNQKDKEAFIWKAVDEWIYNDKTTILIIPARTETDIFHEAIAGVSKVELIRKRVKFKGINTKGEYVDNATGQTGSMFVTFGPGIKPEITTVVV